MIFEVRDLWPEVPIAIGALSSPISKWAAYALQTLAYRSSRHIVALSPDMKDGIIARGFSEDKISVIPNSSDVEIFKSSQFAVDNFRQEYEWLQDRPLILYAGAIGRVNDVRFIVRLAHAAATIRPDWRFLVVGEGAERSVVTTLAQQLGVLNSNFFVVDPRPKFEMAPIFAASTLTLSTVAPIPELAANSANKFFDSFAAGKPIAINHGGWQAKVLGESGAGLVLDPFDPTENVESMARLIEDADRYEAARSAARYLAEEVYARDLHAQQLEAILMDAVTGSRGTSSGIK